MSAGSGDAGKSLLLAEMVVFYFLFLAVYNISYRNELGWNLRSTFIYVDYITLQPYIYEKEVKVKGQSERRPRISEGMVLKDPFFGWCGHSSTHWNCSAGKSQV